MANGYLSGRGAGGVETVAWTRAKPRPRQRPDPCEEPCTPRCPACGGLECLCRPRFFPGQLLTDEDLNRLQRYVIDKNRLHNRYLHGWGVACGLEVVCDVCDPGHVVVRTGYALSPCGDDIVVCADQSVDVCSLINACEPREPLCEGPYDAPPRDCTGGVKKWVLAICYDERPVRGITAQLGAGDTPASARCGCGGGGGCSCGGCASPGGSKNGGCGCGGASAEPPAKGRKPYKPQCEPTQVCEGYRFMAYPAPKDVRLDPWGGQDHVNPDLIWPWLYANRAHFGPLIERVLCCIARAMELRQGYREGLSFDRASATSAYREYASALAEFAADFATHRCGFVTRVYQLRDEAAAFDFGAIRTRPARAAAFERQVTVLDLAWADIVSECLCSALLPACPPPANTNCVPLAVVTISDGDCRVVEICNWSQRKLLISWPTIGYWFSWLPWNKLRAWIAAMCCGSDRSAEAMRLMMLLFGTIFTNLRTSAPEAVAVSPERAGMEAMRMSGVADFERRPSRALKDAFDSDNLLTHLLGGFDRLRSEGAQAADEPGWAELVARLSGASLTSPTVIPDPKVSALVSRLEAAEAEIAKLKKQRRGNR